MSGAVSSSAQAVRIGDWIGFAALCLGMFMAILDIQIVATALPDIQAALRISTDKMSWIQTAYLIAEVIAIPLTGWLSTVMSTRLMFVAAVTGFTLASLGCAASTGFADLVLWRIVQGFCGGVIIPSVFSAVFVLFPLKRQGLATMVAGTMAMLAPTLGPLIGGWITETYSWHWLFLINLAPGLVVALLVFRLIDFDRPNWALARQLDAVALVLFATALAGLEILLKEAPKRGWLSAEMIALAALVPLTAIPAVRRCLHRTHRLIDFAPFRDLRFSVGCWYSFVLGMGLYGSVYLMPIFLAYIRQHSPLEIGLIVVVTGAAQLVAAPFAVVAEQRFDPRTVTGFGFALLAVGLVLGGRMTYQTDFDEMFVPQILRGLAIPFCLLPTTRLALGTLPDSALQNASGLFNLMRNLGGAIGLALIDTVIERRPAGHVTELVEKLQAGDRATALLVGLPPERFTGTPIGPIDQATIDTVTPLVGRAAAVLSFNEAWLMLGGLIGLSLLMLPALRGTSVASHRIGSPHV